ncbi:MULTISPECIES: hypothetical protein [unclassified Sporosarcina]|uniref:hypothetical protein n=1 Tax=unclassified Sporosarcina TaxID=2647733 RepID=UPI00203B44F2|nr:MULTISPECIES: hypothetical protein [unclassified Sporosarcina]GKV64665.1 hypothetical protein NCCP2331_08180 [Sporosarcina sp. NCCP-2331]GLB54462.1 hypothetical protein NCCP2378_02470 [Sporosarcina sp. NCCP-2378]
MENKRIDLENSFSVEIGRIKNIITGLENGYIQELTNSSYHGALSTNVGNLKKELNELFDKIQYGKESDSDKMSDLF